MAIVHFINSKSKQTIKGMACVLRYTTQDSKTITDYNEKLVTGVNCNADSAYTEFCNTKKLFGKQDGRQYYHFVQSLLTLRLRVKSVGTLNYMTINF